MTRPMLRLSFCLVCLAFVWPAAPAAAASANMFARVSAGGVLLGGSEVTGVTYLPPGRYEVTFTRPVDACAYVATTVKTGIGPLTVFTAGGHFGPNGVYVETKNQGGGLTDAPFELVVDCGLNGMKFAVVDYAGGLARATSGTIIGSPAPGRYNVTFPTSVKNCAYIATVGDPDNALVFNPAGVYTANGPTSYTVYVETKNLAGGLEAGIPFHLAVICTNTKSRWAVVDDGGIAKRASTLTSAFRSSTGAFTAVTNLAIFPACATVATRGSVNAAVPFTPATIELVNGPAANTRSFEIRTLGFFGAGLVNESFHAAAVCR